MLVQNFLRIKRDLKVRGEKLSQQKSKQEGNP